VKAWDTHNNSNTKDLQFIVADNAEMSIQHVLNYPNPFTTHTEFFFEHNQPCQALEVTIQVFSISGKLVKTIQTLMTNGGYRSEGIAWDGRDDFGDKIGKGVYVYRVHVKNPSGKQVEKFEKLVLLR
jgi:flagellar hook assembly protein FlgD